MTHQRHRDDSRERAPHTRARREVSDGAWAEGPRRGRGPTVSAGGDACGSARGFGGSRHPGSGAVPPERIDGSGAVWVHSRLSHLKERAQRGEGEDGRETRYRRSSTQADRRSPPMTMAAQRVAFVDHLARAREELEAVFTLLTEAGATHHVTLGKREPRGWRAWARMRFRVTSTRCSPRSRERGSTGRAPKVRRCAYCARTHAPPGDGLQPHDRAAARRQARRGQASALPEGPASEPAAGDLRPVAARGHRGRRRRGLVRAQRGTRRRRDGRPGARSPSARASSWPASRTRWSRSRSTARISRRRCGDA